MYKNISFALRTQAFIKLYGTYLNHIRIWIFNFLLKLIKYYLKCSRLNIGFLQNVKIQILNVEMSKEETLEIFQFPPFGNEEKT